MDESKHTLEMYHEVRHDGLKLVQLTSMSMEEEFEGREDRLYHRHTLYGHTTQPLPIARRNVQVCILMELE